MRRKPIYEVFDLVQKAKTKQEKIDLLKENWSPVLASILFHAYSPSVKFLLPETDPPYKPCEAPDCDMMLFQEARRFYLFVEGGNPGLKQSKRERLFIEILECVHPKDAKILLSMKNKKIPCFGLSAGLIKEAFPGLLQEAAKPNSTAPNAK